MDSIDWAETRNWLYLVFLICGFWVAYNEFKSNTRQKQTENSFKYIELFYKSLKEDDIDNWTNVYWGSYDRGSVDGFSFGDEGDFKYIDVFTEGPPENGCIDRMAEFI